MNLPVETDTDEIRRIRAAAKQIRETSDVFVVIGTSLVVYPAASLIDYAPSGIPKFLIDPNEMRGGMPLGFQHIKAKAVEGVDELVMRLEMIG